MEWDYGTAEPVEIQSRGVFIVNEGNFQYGNASLSFYNPASQTVENGIFSRANGMKLGDVAQSMTIVNNTAWIVVNNSHVIFKIDATTLRETGRLADLISPRYMLYIDAHKAYVSQLWDNHITIIDPTQMTITGSIEVPGMDATNGSTEQMVIVDGMVYVTCWSFQNRIIKIDPTDDKVVGALIVGVQPKSIVADNKKHLWVLTDGGYAGNPAGYEPPALVEINPTEMTVIRRLRMALDDSPASLITDGSGSTLYWINTDVYRMSPDSGQLPSTPFIISQGTTFYDMTVDPDLGDIYIADAIDYQQPGIIYRYDCTGNIIDEFRAGVTPGAFAWKGRSQ